MKKDSTKLRKWILFFALITFILSFSIGFRGLFFLALTICLFFLAIFIKKRETDNWKDGFNWLVDFFKQISVYFFGLLIIGAVIGLFFGILGIKLDDLDSVFRFFPPTYLLFMGLSAGPLEELIFRWGVLNFIRKILAKLTKHKDIIALVLSSFLFALVHIIGNMSVAYRTLYIIPVFVIGLILGKIYIKKGLIEAMWLHSLYNMFVIFLNYILVQGWWFG